LGAGALVQSSVGFGMGLVATPLLVFAGCSLPQAIASLLPNVLVQTAFSCWRYRRDLPWADVAPICLWRYLGLPVGVWLLGLVNDQGQAVSRAILGLGLLAVLATQQLPVNLPQRRPGRLATLLAGSSSGVLAGWLGIGGPPLVLWVVGQDWNTQRQRCFLWLSFLLVIPLQLLIMSWRFGVSWVRDAAHGLAVVPVVLLSAWLGGVWSQHWSKHRLRQAMRLFLLLIALRLIWHWASTVWA
jgi:hypothetical protein